MSKRLIIISVAGLVLIGGAYWYTNWHNQPSRTPPPPRPRPVRQVAKPRPPRPPTAATRLQVKPKPARLPVASPRVAGPRAKQSPTPAAKQLPAPLKVEGPKVPSKVAKPVVTPRESLKPVSPPAQVERPTPKRLARATEPTAKPEKRYSVQVASLVIERNALALKKQLEKLGYSPTIEKTTAPIKRHRVYAGEFSSRDAAEQTARRLGVDGFSSNMVETEQRKFALEVGWSFSLNGALDLAHGLQKKNYASRIVSHVSPTPVHVVRVGSYKDRSDAVRAIEALKTKGFAPLIVRN
ncbi:MAG: SPOR domain-containing protein [Candidatus Methylomirabilales bacterium]